MNSLPPELVSSIVEQAAQCDSTYDSYRSRLHTLSALSLVNRTFRRLAQRLLPQKVWFRQESELDRFKRTGRMEKVGSLKFELKRYEVSSGSLQGFSFMTEVKICNTDQLNITNLNQHQHLKRFALEATSLVFESEFALPRLEELSLADVHIYGRYFQTAATSVSSFLAPSHFPSLRAVGIKSFHWYNSIRNVYWSYVPIDYSLVNQLDCITLDENGYQDWIQSRQISPGSSLSSSFSVPRLFDVGSTTLPSFPDTPAYTNAHVRLRRSSESITNRPQIEEVLSFVQDLLTRSTVLQEVYLDFRSRGGSKSYRLGADLEEELERLEVLAKEKKVEIIREKHEDDWCESRVSREFWRRCREKKEKAREDK